MSARPRQGHWNAALGSLRRRVFAGGAHGRWPPRELIARVRGQQTIRRMRELGLRAPDPFSIASGTYVDGGFAWAVQIGADTVISANVEILAHDAAMKHLTGYTLVLPVVIGEGCYIGARSIILAGAVIGDGAIIGAGSLVRGEVPSGAIAAGNPARVIGQASDLRERHLRLMAEAECFEKGPAHPGGLSDREVAAMQQALAKHGRLYVR